MDKKIEGLIIILILALAVLVINVEITGKVPGDKAGKQMCTEECIFQEDCGEGRCQEDPEDPSKMRCLSCPKAPKDEKDVSGPGTGDGVGIRKPGVGDSGAGDIGTSVLEGPEEEAYDFFRQFFDVGKQYSTTKGLLKTIGEGAIKKGYTSPLEDILDVKGAAIDYSSPNPDIKNLDKTKWEFKTYFSTVPGKPGGGKYLESGGYLHCDGNGLCSIDWLDYYGFAGCELNMLSAQIEFHKTEKRADIVGPCNWYDGAELERLKEQPRTGVYERTGNLNKCDRPGSSYDIQAVCSGAFNTDGAWPDVNKIKLGTLQVVYFTTVPVGSYKEGETPERNKSKVATDKYAFSAERNGGRQPSPKRRIPRVAGVTAEIAAGGLGFGAGIAKLLY